MIILWCVFGRPSKNLQFWAVSQVAIPTLQIASLEPQYVVCPSYDLLLAFTAINRFWKRLESHRRQTIGVGN